MFKEFKTFISRGSVIDLAIGVIIGGAFGKIIASIIADIIMPPIGLLISNVNFREIQWKIGGTLEKPVNINIGNFIQTTIEFLIIAFVIFLIVKGINATKKKEEEKPAVEPEPTKTEILLTEIRDSLKK